MPGGHYGGHLHQPFRLGLLRGRDAAAVLARCRRPYVRPLAGALHGSERSMARRRLGPGLLSHGIPIEPDLRTAAFGADLEARGTREYLSRMTRLETGGTMSVNPARGLPPETLPAPR